MGIRFFAFDGIDHIVYCILYLRFAAAHTGAHRRHGFVAMYRISIQNIKALFNVVPTSLDGWCQYVS